MNDPLEQLIAALREELQQYGEMLALLETQQEQVITRASGQILETMQAVDEQSNRINAARLNRGRCARDLADLFEHRDLGRMHELVPLVPPDYRPLLTALIDENNSLLTKVRSRARQNHLLLSRSLDLMNEFMNSIAPRSGTTVYNGGGRVYSSASAERFVCDLVG